MNGLLGFATEWLLRAVIPGLGVVLFGALLVRAITGAEGIEYRIHLGVGSVIGLLIVSTFAAIANRKTVVDHLSKYRRENHLGD